MRELASEDTALALLGSNSADVDPLSHIRAQSDGDCPIGINLSKGVRTADRILEFVRVVKVILLPNQVTNSVVETNALGILPHKSFVNEKLTVVPDGNDVCNVGYVHEHVTAKGHSTRSASSER